MKDLVICLDHKRRQHLPSAPAERAHCLAESAHLFEGLPGDWLW